MVFSSGADQATPPTPKSLPSQVQDVASVARDRLQDVVSHIRGPETRSGLRDGWDKLVTVLFAPCAGDANIGGVPREEVGAGGGSERARGRGASVPFEVPASQGRTSSFQASFSQHAQKGPAPANAGALPQQRAMTEKERREARSRARLRQLGARHQLASGLAREGIADAAQPVSPRAEVGELSAKEALYASGGPVSPDLVDFDDGISAISSHTLEEMERRRLTRERKNMVRLGPNDCSHIIDEENVLNDADIGLKGMAILEEGENMNTEVVFGAPFYEEVDYHNVRTVGEGNGKQHLEIKSQKTQDTTVTEDSHEFEEMLQKNEAMYWSDRDQVAQTETQATRCRPAQRMSIEDRARRLRELSRSRSRSDGTGSSNKSGSSSLASGQHPHDTVPVFTSDLFSRRKKKSHGSGKSRRSHTSGSIRFEGNDPFASLDYGEI